MNAIEASIERRLDFIEARDVRVKAKLDVLYRLVGHDEEMWDTLLKIAEEAVRRKQS
jgi:hypothetical protein